MLVAQLGVELILKFPEGGVLVTRYGDRCCLALGRTGFYKMFEAVVVDVICRRGGVQAEKR